MSNVDIGLIVLAVIAWAAVGGVRALVRQFGRDRIFAGVTPGQLPGPNQPRQIERVKGGQEYSGEVAVQFQPPRGLTPGLVGTIVDGKAEMRDVTATILDLAVRKYVRITPVDTPVQGRKDWVITRLPDSARRPSDQPLLGFERRLLTDLFVYGEQVRMSELGGRFGRTMHEVREDLYRSVQELGWYERHPQDRGGCLGTLAVIAGIVGGVMFGLAGGSIYSVIAGIGLVGAGFALGDALKWRTPRTALGTAVQVQTLGFKKYLETAEADQIRFEEAADIFSRYLPYAIVFGVADHWAKVFGDVARRAEAVGYDMPMYIDWFDGLYLAMVVDDLIIGGADGFGLLDMADGFDLLELGSGAVDGLGDFAGSIGDFVDGIDLDFFDF